MIINIAKSIIITTFTLFFISCKKTETLPVDPVAAVLNLPATPFNYSNIALPAYLNTPNILGQINTPAGNPITDNGATLGRVLFYDKSLSINNTIACASCHKQANSFADAEVKSIGFNGGLTGRHSMSLINAKYYPNGRFFWDQRAATLEDRLCNQFRIWLKWG